MNKELVLVKVSGPDQPGITAGLMAKIATSGCVIEDIGQSITHGLLSLSILLDTTKEGPKDLIKELLFEAKNRGVTLDFDVISDVKTIQSNGDKYIVSCVALEGISSLFLRDIATTLASNGINIQRIDNVTHGGCRSLDIAVTAMNKTTKWTQVKEDLLTISNIHKTDVAIIKDNVWRRNKRMIIFDMDSTLIQSEVIVEMAKEHGVGDQVHEITERAMNGEYDFDESLRERVKLLKGLKENVLKEVLDRIKLSDGTEQFIKVVKKLGYKMAIISGGFTFFAHSFKERLGIDYAFANQLEIQNGELTGEIKGEIINGEKKALLVELIAQQEGINLEQVVAIGDGANDLKMLAKAGLGIAFHAKDIVRKSADQHMSHGPMTSILYFLGVPELEIE